MGFIIETPLSPNMAGRPTRLIARDVFLSAIWRVEYRGVKRGDKVQVLLPRANTIQSVPCRFSVFVPSRWYHASRGQTRSPRASTAQSVPCLFSQSLRCVSLNPRASTIQSVPCRFSAFIPSQWHDTSRGQTWHP